LRLLRASFGAFVPAGESDVQAEERRSFPLRWSPSLAACEEERLLIPAMLYVEPAKLPGVEGVLESSLFSGMVDDLCMTRLADLLYSLEPWFGVLRGFDGENGSPSTSDKD
jgi:hypothetical protein